MSPPARQRSKARQARKTPAATSPNFVPSPLEPAIARVTEPAGVCCRGCLRPIEGPAVWIAAVWIGVPSPFPAFAVCYGCYGGRTSSP
jgi:hypothetical protein